MATTAAQLQIQVIAETTKAALNLRKLDKQLTGVDKTTATATTRTTNLGRASSKAGSMLKGAAVSAASAAAAYISISQAKAAVETTQSLAGASATLSRNLGLTAKQASRWASVAGTRDISTQQLNASFTTLAQKLTDARSGTDEAVESFEALGITQKDLQKDGGNFNKTILRVSDALDKAEGGAQRQAAASRLLGRGYQTLVPIMGQGSDALREQLKLGDKYGSTMGVKAVEANTNFAASLRESERAWQGLQVQFTNAILPALQKANNQFQRLAVIMASDKLTNAEKFQKVGKIIGRWADVALDAFIKVLPKIVERAGEAAPRIAKAFIEGFMNAPAWGKLLIGGWLLTKLGGLAAFARVGGKAGTTFGRGLLGKAGIIGAIIAFGPDVLKESFNLGKKAGQAVVDAFGGTAESVKNVKEIGSKFGGAIADFSAHAQKGLPGYKKALKEREQLTDKHIDRAIAEQKKYHDQQERLTEGGMRRVTAENKRGLNLNEQEFEASRRKLENTTKKQSRQVVGNTEGMVNKSSQAIKKLGNNTNNALKAFGAKTLSFKIELAKSGAQSGFARGGPIDQGKPSGDSVPALLEKGEYVLNRNAVRAAGKGNLDALNFGAARRFQKGGGLNFALGPYNIPPIEYASDHAGGNSHVHVTGTTTPWTVAMGRKFQRMGWTVGEHPAFGGVGGGHSATGGHYDALAFDANTANDETRAEVAAAARMLGGAGGFAFERLKRMILKGPDGPLKDMGQRAMDKVWKAGKNLIAKSTPSSGIAPTMTGSGDVERVFAKVAKRISSSKTATLALGMAGYAESGMRDLSYGDASSQGALQLLSSTAAGLGVSPHDEAAIASLFFTRGFYGRGGANTLAASGLPAHMVAQSVQGSADASGSNYLAQKGSAKGWMKRFGLQAGGMLGLQGGGSPFAPKGPFGRAHMRLAQLPGMKKRVGRLAKQIAKTDERIQIQQTLAGLPTSPGGAELAGSEKNRQLGLYDRLLEQLMGQRTVARQGFRTSKHFKKNPAFFRDVLVELEGLTGGAGRLLDTKVALAELRATPPAGTGGISIDDLLRIREGMTLGLLGNGLAAGGAAPSPSAGPEVNINYANGMEWLRDFVSVQVDGRDRRTNIRSLAGVRR